MIIFVFFLGLSAGSFLNAVIYRLHKKKSFWGRSFCPHCKHQLKFFDLIPLLSFFLQKRRCRYCRKHISWQYPLVELSAGLVFSLFYLKYFSGFIWSIEYLSLLDKKIFFTSLLFMTRDWFFASFLFIIFVYDLKYYLILDKVALPVLVFSFLFNLFLGFSWLDLMIGAVVIGGFFLFQYLISRGKWIGGGDIRLGLLMGAMLGWREGLLSLFLAYFIGAFIGIILILAKKKKWQSEVPMGTFLASSTILVLLYGEKILNWYF